MADINNDNSFMIRLRSSIILTAITIAAIVLGGWTLFGVLALVSVIGLFELYRAVGVHKKAIGFVGFVFAACWYVIIGCMQSGLIKDTLIGFVIMGYIALLLVCVLTAYVFSFPNINSEQAATVFFGLFYVVFSLSFIYLTRCLDGGALAVWLIFLGSWGADTSAYLVGRKIGKHKITPKLSPKKSLEGFIGGVIGAALLAFIYSLIFKEGLSKSFTNPMVIFTVTAAVASMVSMVGDLAASAIKRDKQIKDYGKLIPGHGGILDRFDSVIFVAPVCYFLLWICSVI